MTKILIVEDDVADTYIAKKALKKHFPEVELHFATNGSEAIEILKEQNFGFHVVLLDINMPLMNGHEFLHEFKAIHNNEVPVVVMLTSSNQEQDKQKANAYEAVKGFLVKPLDQGNIAKLREVLLSLGAKAA